MKMGAQDPHPMISSWFSTRQKSQVQFLTLLDTLKNVTLCVTWTGYNEKEEARSSVLLVERSKI